MYFFFDFKIFFQHTKKNIERKRSEKKAARKRLKKNLSKQVCILDLTKLLITLKINKKANIYIF